MIDVKFSELDSPWVVDAKRGVFTSSIEKDQDDQRIIFDQPFRDGRIKVDLTIKGGTKSDSTADPRVGALIFRFQDSRNYYFAGIGADSNKFFVYKKIDGQNRPIAATGSSRSIEVDHPYSIAVRCSGNQIVLSHNNVVQLRVFDSALQSGQWGLQSRQTRVEFRGPASETVKPNCFVIMPFAPEFDDVYKIIREMVEAHSFECIRAEERYLIGTIMDDVNDQIEKADLIVADLTGRNPNVFYEVGYAAALRKSVIQIAQSASDLPFDVRHLRTFSYSTRMLGDRKLAHDLSEAIRATA